MALFKETVILEFDEFLLNEWPKLNFIQRNLRNGLKLFFLNQIIWVVRRELLQTKNSVAKYLHTSAICIFENNVVKIIAKFTQK